MILSKFHLRKESYRNSRLFGTPAEAATVYSRVDSLTQSDRLLGAAWAALREAYYKDHADKMLIVEYDRLVKKPLEVTKIIYQFLNEPWYEGHNFECLDFSAPHYDQAIGLRYIHQVRPKVEVVRRATILLPDIVKKFFGQSFW